MYRCPLRVGLSTSKRDIYKCVCHPTKFSVSQLLESYFQGNRSHPSAWRSLLWPPICLSDARDEIMYGMYEKSTRHTDSKEWDTCAYRIMLVSECFKFKDCFSLIKRNSPVTLRRKIGLTGRRKRRTLLTHYVTYIPWTRLNKNSEHAEERRYILMS